MRLDDQISLKSPP